MNKQPTLTKLSRIYLVVHALNWLEITPEDPRRKTKLWEQWPGRCEICHQYEFGLKEKSYRLLSVPDEAEFRATQAMTAITRCYPGPHPAGRGDRVPTRAEQAFCAPWLEAELALIAPRVLILIGGLAIGKFLGHDTTMTELIGEQFERDGRIIVPLPHPSGASQWFHTPENKARLERALEILAELRADLLSK